MAQGASFALGRERRFNAEVETTFGTYIKPTTTGSMVILNHQFSPSIARTDRRDARPGSRGVFERITGKETVEWNVSSFLLAKGSTTEPDIHELLLGAFGNGAINASTFEYTLSGGVGDLECLSLTCKVGEYFMEAVAGAWVEEMTINASGGEEPTIEFSGGAQRYIHTGSASIAGSTSSGQNDVIVLGTGTDDSESFNFNVDSVVGIFDQDDDSEVDTNSGAGYQVTSITNATHTVTVTPTFVTGSTGTDKELRPVTAWDVASTGGTIITSTLGQFDLGRAVTVPAESDDIPDESDVTITGFSVTLKNNVKAIDNASFQSTVTDVIPGNREVSGEFTLFGRREHLIWLNRRRQVDNSSWNSIPVTVTLGDTAGNHLVIEMPAVELDPSSAWDIPDAPSGEEMTITVPFMAKDTGVATDDSIKLIWK